MMRHLTSLFRLVVRMSPLHGEDTGSKPVKDTLSFMISKIVSATSLMYYYFQIFIFFLHSSLSSMYGRDLTFLIFFELKVLIRSSLVYYKNHFFWNRPHEETKTVRGFVLMRFFLRLIRKLVHFFLSIVLRFFREVFKIIAHFKAFVRGRVMPVPLVFMSKLKFLSIRTLVFGLGFCVLVRKLPQTIGQQCSIAYLRFQEFVFIWLYYGTYYWPLHVESVYLLVQQMKKLRLLRQLNATLVERYSYSKNELRLVFRSLSAFIYSTSLIRFQDMQISQFWEYGYPVLGYRPSTLVDAMYQNNGYFFWSLERKQEMDYYALLEKYHFIPQYLRTPEMVTSTRPSAHLEQILQWIAECKKNQNHTVAEHILKEIYTIFDEHFQIVLYEEALRDPLYLTRLHMFIPQDPRLLQTTKHLQYPELLFDPAIVEKVCAHWQLTVKQSHYEFISWSTTPEQNYVFGQKHFTDYFRQIRQALIETQDYGWFAREWQLGLQLYFEWSIYLYYLYFPTLRLHAHYDIGVDKDPYDAVLPYFTLPGVSLHETLVLPCLLFFIPISIWFTKKAIIPVYEESYVDAKWYLDLRLKFILYWDYDVEHTVANDILHIFIFALIIPAYYDWMRLPWQRDHLTWRYDLENYTRFVEKARRGRHTISGQEHISGDWEAQHLQRELSLIMPLREVAQTSGRNRKRHRAPILSHGFYNHIMTTPFNPYPRLRRRYLRNITNHMWSAGITYFEQDWVTGLSRLLHMDKQLRTFRKVEDAYGAKNKYHGWYAVANMRPMDLTHYKTWVKQTYKDVKHRGKLDKPQLEKRRLARQTGSYWMVTYLTSFRLGLLKRWEIARLTAPHIFVKTELLTKEQRYKWFLETETKYLYNELSNNQFLAHLKKNPVILESLPQTTGSDLYPIRLANTNDPYLQMMASFPDAPFHRPALGTGYTNWVAAPEEVKPFAVQPLLLPSVHQWIVGPWVWRRNLTWKEQVAFGRLKATRQKFVQQFVLDNENPIISLEPPYIYKKARTLDFGVRDAFPTESSSEGFLKLPHAITSHSQLNPYYEWLIFLHNRDLETMAVTYPKNYFQLEAETPFRLRLQVINFRAWLRKLSSKRFGWPPMQPDIVRPRQEDMTSDPLTWLNSSEAEILRKRELYGLTGREHFNQVAALRPKGSLIAKKLPPLYEQFLERKKNAASLQLEQRALACYHHSAHKLLLMASGRKSIPESRKAQELRYQRALTTYQDFLRQHQDVRAFEEAQNFLRDPLSNPFLKNTKAISEEQLSYVHHMTNHVNRQVIDHINRLTDSAIPHIYIPKLPPITFPTLPRISLPGGDNLKPYVRTYLDFDFGEVFQYPYNCKEYSYNDVYASDRGLQKIVTHVRSKMYIKSARRAVEDGVQSGAAIQPVYGPARYHLRPRGTWFPYYTKKLIGYFRRPTKDKDGKAHRGRVFVQNKSSYKRMVHYLGRNREWTHVLNNPLLLRINPKKRSIKRLFPLGLPKLPVLLKQFFKKKYFETYRAFHNGFLTLVDRYLPKSMFVLTWKTGETYPRLRLRSPFGWGQAQQTKFSIQDVLTSRRPNVFFGPEDSRVVDYAKGRLMRVLLRLEPFDENNLYDALKEATYGRLAVQQKYQLPLPIWSNEELRRRAESFNTLQLLWGNHRGGWSFQNKYVKPDFKTLIERHAQVIAIRFTMTKPFTSGITGYANDMLRSELKDYYQFDHSMWDRYPLIDTAAFYKTGYEFERAWLPPSLPLSWQFKNVYGYNRGQEHTSVAFKHWLQRERLRTNSFFDEVNAEFFKHVFNPVRYSRMATLRTRSANNEVRNWHTELFNYTRPQWSAIDHLGATKKYTKENLMQPSGSSIKTLQGFFTQTPLNTRVAADAFFDHSVKTSSPLAFLQGQLGMPVNYATRTHDRYVKRMREAAVGSAYAMILGENLINNSRPFSLRLWYHVHNPNKTRAEVFKRFLLQDQNRLFLLRNLNLGYFGTVFSHTQFFDRQTAKGLKNKWRLYHKPKYTQQHVGKAFVKKVGEMQKAVGYRYSYRYLHPKFWRKYYHPTKGFTLGNERGFLSAHVWPGTGEFINIYEIIKSIPEPSLRVKAISLLFKGGAVNDLFISDVTKSLDKTPLYVVAERYIDVEGGLPGSIVSPADMARQILTYANDHHAKLKLVSLMTSLAYTECLDPNTSLYEEQTFPAYFQHTRRTRSLAPKSTAGLRIRRQQAQNDYQKTLFETNRALLYANVLVPSAKEVETLAKLFQKNGFPLVKQNPNYFTKVFPLLDKQKVSSNFHERDSFEILSLAPHTIKGYASTAAKFYYNLFLDGPLDLNYLKALMLSKKDNDVPSRVWPIGYVRDGRYGADGEHTWKKEFPKRKTKRLHYRYEYNAKHLTAKTAPYRKKATNALARYLQELHQFREKLVHQFEETPAVAEYFESFPDFFNYIRMYSREHARVLRRVTRRILQKEDFNPTFFFRPKATRIQYLERVNLRLYRKLTKNVFYAVSQPQAQGVVLREGILPVLEDLQHFNLQTTKEAVPFFTAALMVTYPEVLREHILPASHKAKMMWKEEEAHLLQAISQIKQEYSNAYNAEDREDLIEPLETHLEELVASRSNYGLLPFTVPVEFHGERLKPLRNEHLWPAEVLRDWMYFLEAQKQSECLDLSHSFTPDVSPEPLSMPNVDLIKDFYRLVDINAGFPYCGSFKTELPHYNLRISSYQNNNLWVLPKHPENLAFDRFRALYTFEANRTVVFPSTTRAQERRTMIGGIRMTALTDRIVIPYNQERLLTQTTRYMWVAWPESDACFINPLTELEPLDHRIRYFADPDYWQTWHSTALRPVNVRDQMLLTGLYNIMQPAPNPLQYLTQATSPLAPIDPFGSYCHESKGMVPFEWFDIYDPTTEELISVNAMRVRTFSKDQYLRRYFGLVRPKSAEWSWNTPFAAVHHYDNIITGFVQPDNLIAQEFAAGQLYTNSYEYLLTKFEQTEKLLGTEFAITHFLHKYYGLMPKQVIDFLVYATYWGSMWVHAIYHGSFVEAHLAHLRIIAPRDGLMETAGDLREWEQHLRNTRRKHLALVNGEESVNNALSRWESFAALPLVLGNETNVFPLNAPMKIMSLWERPVRDQVKTWDLKIPSQLGTIFRKQLSERQVSVWQLPERSWSSEWLELQATLDEQREENYVDTSIFDDTVPAQYALQELQVRRTELTEEIARASAVVESEMDNLKSFKKEIKKIVPAEKRLTRQVEAQAQQILGDLQQMLSSLQTLMVRDRVTMNPSLQKALEIATMALGEREPLDRLRETPINSISRFLEDGLPKTRNSKQGVNELLKSYVRSNAQLGDYRGSTQRTIEILSERRQALQEVGQHVASSSLNQKKLILVLFEELSVINGALQEQHFAQIMRRGLSVAEVAAPQKQIYEERYRHAQGYLRTLQADLDALPKQEEYLHSYIVKQRALIESERLRVMKPTEVLLDKYRQALEQERLRLEARLEQKRLRLEAAEEQKQLRILARLEQKRLRLEGLLEQERLRIEALLEQEREQERLRLEAEEARLEQERLRIEAEEAQERLNLVARIELERDQERLAMQLELVKLSHESNATEMDRLRAFLDDARAKRLAEDRVEHGLPALAVSSAFDYIDDDSLSPQSRMQVALERAVLPVEQQDMAHLRRQAAELEERTMYGEPEQLFPLDSGLVDTFDDEGPLDLALGDVVDAEDPETFSGPASGASLVPVVTSSLRDENDPELLAEIEAGNKEYFRAEEAFIAELRKNLRRSHPAIEKARSVLKASQEPKMLVRSLEEEEKELEIAVAEEETFKRFEDSLIFWGAEDANEIVNNTQGGQVRSPSPRINALSQAQLEELFFARQRINPRFSWDQTRSTPAASLTQNVPPVETRSTPAASLTQNVPPVETRSTPAASLTQNVPPVETRSTPAASSFLEDLVTTLPQTKLPSLTSLLGREPNLLSADFRLLNVSSSPSPATDNATVLLGEFASKSELEIAQYIYSIRVLEARESREIETSEEYEAFMNRAVQIEQQMNSLAPATRTRVEHLISQMPPYEEIYFAGAEESDDEDKIYLDFGEKP